MLKIGDHVRLPNGFVGIIKSEPKTIVDKTYYRLHIPAIVELSHYYPEEDLTKLSDEEVRDV
ncbi:MAG: hypothetical protein KAU20_05640 [Nanoarchaeota archaeon]|nr:hypothetical protein [Nanoarchaeota archaeon]